ncbi:hypothetical protein A3715_14745 [Oleiphilus sp. HI0009]|nr:hypothetical protein A3715_14745 [Oleiphilus sp. HI0009]KZY69864.1 hypothetical protein A3739_07945 [Oleiphilus sp. HI0067]KZY72325.1 hypothetical protein A3738_00180 [Oleiphilus sp. HI0066]
MTEAGDYLKPYFFGIKALKDAASNLQVLTSDNPNQQVRLEKLMTLIDVKFDELQQTIDLVDEGNARSSEE